MREHTHLVGPYLDSVENLLWKNVVTRMFIFVLTFNSLGGCLGVFFLKLVNQLINQCVCWWGYPFATVFMWKSKDKWLKWILLMWVLMKEGAQAWWQAPLYA